MNRAILLFFIVGLASCTVPIECKGEEDEVAVFIRTGEVFVEVISSYQSCSSDEECEYIFWDFQCPDGARVNHCGVVSFSNVTEALLEQELDIAMAEECSSLAACYMNGECDIQTPYCSTSGVCTSQP